MLSKTKDLIDHLSYQSLDAFMYMFARYVNLRNVLSRTKNNIYCIHVTSPKIRKVRFHVASARKGRKGLAIRLASIFTHEMHFYVHCKEFASRGYQILVCVTGFDRPPTDVTSSLSPECTAMLSQSAYHVVRHVTRQDR